MQILPRIAFVGLLAGVLAAPVMADPYRVSGLVVEGTGATNNDAQIAGRTQARTMGAQRLVQRLTLPEDLSAAQTPLDYGEISRLYSSLDIVGDEKRSATAAGARYTGTLAVNYDAKAVREYLNAHGVHFVDSQAGKALLVPSASAGVDAAQWGALWVMLNPQGQTVGKSDDTLLTPYVASIDSFSHHPAWNEVQSDVQASRSERAVVAEAYQQGGQYYVRLSDLRANGETQLGTTAAAPTLAAAQAQALAGLEYLWKTASIVRTSGSTQMALVASFRSIGEWVRIRKALETSRLVTGLQTESISSTGADLSFTFSGRPDQLAGDLRSRGIDLRGTDGGWIVTVSGSQ
jgi:hypothetical protein